MAFPGFELGQPKTAVESVECEPSRAVRLTSVRESEVTSILLSLYRERLWQISFDSEGTTGFNLAVRFDKHDLLLVVKLPDLGVDLILSFACDRQSDVKLSDVSTLECDSIGVVSFAVVRGVHLSTLLFLGCRTKSAQVELEPVVFTVGIFCPFGITELAIDDVRSVCSQCGRWMFLRSDGGPFVVIFCSLLGKRIEVEIDVVGVALEQGFLWTIAVVLPFTTCLVMPTLRPSEVHHFLRASDILAIRHTSQRYRILAVERASGHGCHWPLVGL